MGGKAEQRTIMVKLDRIYTRGGDGGETSLVDGSRVRKGSLRIAAMGDVDEANAVIGLARRCLEAENPDLAPVLARAQNDLFDMGADLATPGADPSDGSLRIQAGQVARLENEIDALNEPLQPLTSFVLPGGTEAATWLHLARTVVRRAERTVSELARETDINPRVPAYLNRLSDLVFVMARVANENGAADVQWQPGMTAGEGSS